VSGAGRTGDDFEDPLAATASFWPFGAEADSAAAYLREVHTLGGAPVQAYKALSYRLLNLRPGMRVLDVGCGSGDDLLDLAELVGESGAAVGLDHNSGLAEEARTLLGERGVRNAWVFQDDAERMQFSAHEFDRVRADRVVQHMRTPQVALAEMWRVLRPGGKLTVIEPDWGMIAVFPASASGGDDDTAFRQILEWCRRHLAHPYIGRQLLALLRHVGASAWAEVRVAVETFTYTSWPECDAVLRLSQAATMLRQENPSASGELDGWLTAVETASERGDFFAAVPLFFAYAMRAT